MLLGSGQLWCSANGHSLVDTVKCVDSLDRHCVQLFLQGICFPPLAEKCSADLSEGGSSYSPSFASLLGFLSSQAARCWSYASHSDPGRMRRD